MSGVDGEDEAAGGGVVAVFTQVDALPGAEVEGVARDGDGERDACQ